jgi:hypothetical protein
MISIWRKNRYTKQTNRMKQTGKTAIIIGATGATGRILVSLLIKDVRYDTIKLFSRRSCNITHPKIKEYLGSLFELENFIEKFTADEVYCAIGTTKKQTPNKLLFKEIDFGIPLKAAKLTSKNNIHKFIVVSSIGANKDSSVFYTRTKGEMETSISNLLIKYTYIFRPSLLLREAKEKRILEYLAGLFMKTFSYLFIGPLKKYRAIETRTLALAMINSANTSIKSKIFSSDEIQDMGK